jgi:hypothetical protein
VATSLRAAGKLSTGPRRVGGVVGPADVETAKEISVLDARTLQNVSLKRKGNFQGHPHPGKPYRVWVIDPGRPNMISSLLKGPRSVMGRRAKPPAALDFFPEAAGATRALIHVCSPTGSNVADLCTTQELACERQCWPRTTAPTCARWTTATIFDREPYVRSLD